MITYKVEKNEYINTWQHTSIKATLYNQIEKEPMQGDVILDEGHNVVIYPVRSEFLETEKNIDYKIAEDSEYKYLYSGFENNKVEFSNFIRNATRLETDHKIYINSPESQVVKFEINTCGKTLIYVNGKCVDIFAPFISNYGAKKEIDLYLDSGINEIVVKSIDLAERNVFYYFSLKLLSDCILDIQIDIPIDQKLYWDTIRYLSDFSFKKDVFENEEITFESNEAVPNDMPDIYLELSEGFNIYNKNISELNLHKLDLTESSIDLTKIGDYSSFVNVIVYIDDIQIRKRFFLSQKITKLKTYDSVEERKKFIIGYLAENGQETIYKTIAKVISKNEIISSSDFGVQDVLHRVNTRGDCADFYLPGAIILLKDYNENLEENVALELKKAILNFRYWIDEPGDDVMWYFSENHALLFHVCQYLSGELFKEELYTNSNRSGQEQSMIGKQRVKDWLRKFLEIGLSEWNSTTYIPIDLIGLFILKMYATDQEIIENTTLALDYIFRVMAINLSGSMISSTYGRCYEKELKAMEFGELTCISWMAWNKGYSSLMTKSTLLYAISDYEPPVEYKKYFDTEEKQSFGYVQGENAVNIKVYKEPGYSVASVQNYKSYEKGHQQHVMNISLGNDNTQLWINHPGELVPSGENRPSYWAGNGRMPQIQQHDNFIHMNYNLTNHEIKFIHCYIPFWKLDSVVIEGNKVTIEKGNTSVIYHFNNEVSMTTTGPNRNREIKVFGENINIAIYVTTNKEDQVEVDFANNNFIINGVKRYIGL